MVTRATRMALRADDGPDGAVGAVILQMTGTNRTINKTPIWQTKTVQIKKL